MRRQWRQAQGRLRLDLIGATFRDRESRIHARKRKPGYGWMINLAALCETLRRN